MPTTYARNLTLPKTLFFLFGPRATGNDLATPGSFVDRGGMVRLISARRATSNERQDYQEGTRL